MATPMDIGLLKEFGAIFPFLLVFIVVYAILIKTEFFKDNKGLASLLAAVCGIMTLFSPIVRDTVTLMAPWMVLLFIFIVFLLVAFMIFGTTEKDIMSLIKSEKFGIGMWVVALALIITIGSLVSVISERGGIGGDDGTEVPEDQEEDFWKTLANTKVLGLTLIFFIASFTIRSLTMDTK